MAFDGITVACIVKELRDTLVNGRINKIAQPEDNALLFTIKTPEHETKQQRLFLSADASLPLMYLTAENKAAPLTAPAFCMLLRKHLSSGRIIDITQPSLERVIRIDVEHLDEMGDLGVRTLAIELMGKHSNIMLLNSDETILDAIKRVPFSVSSVREVLPGREYFIPDTMEKQDPLQADRQVFFQTIRSKAQPLFKTLYTSFTGISPAIAKELCHRADIDVDLPAVSLSDPQADALYDAFSALMRQISEGDFAPEIIYEDGTPKEYAAVPLTMFHDVPGFSARAFESMSDLIHTFYREKEIVTRIRQKSYDLRRVVSTALERTSRKLDLQLNQLKDTEKKETYRLYGELLTAYGYQITDKQPRVTLEDYNTGKDITIPLDETLTAAQNAARYYDRYNKLKRTAADLTERTAEVQAEIDHLQSVAASLDLARSEEDLSPIRDELVATGYIKKRSAEKGKKQDVKSEPYHFVTSDGFDVYVGKNNYQNGLLTNKADGEDWWFHLKGKAGSHVILKTAGREVPDRAFEEAAALAAYYSVARDQDKAEVDYVQRKEIKKPSGAKPGFVVYYTNYSMVITPKTLDFS